MVTLILFLCFVLFIFLNYLLTLTLHWPLVQASNWLTVNLLLQGKAACFLLLLTLFTSHSISAHPKLLRSVQNESTSIRLNPGLSVNGRLLNTRTSSLSSSPSSSSPSSSTESTVPTMASVGSSKPKDNLMAMPFSSFGFEEKNLMASTSNHGKVHYTPVKSETKGRSHTSNRDQYVSASRKQGSYQYYFMGKPSQAAVPNQPGDIATRASYPTGSFARPHPETGVVKMPQLKTLKLDERQKPGFTDFTSALEGYGLKVITHQDAKDLSKINAEALYGPVSSGHEKQEQAYSAPAMNYGQGGLNDQAYGSARGDFPMPSSHQFQNGYKQSSQKNGGGGGGGSETYESSGYDGPQLGPSRPQNVGSHSKQSLSGLTAYISPYEHENNFGTSVHHAYQQSGSPMTYISHATHLSHTPVHQGQSDYESNDGAAGPNHNYESSASVSGLDYSSSVQSQGYAKVPLNLVQNGGQSYAPPQNTQRYKLGPVIIASSSAEDNQGYLSAPITYGSSSANQPLENSFNNSPLINQEYSNGQGSGTGYGQNNENLGSNGYLAASSSGITGHVSNNFHSYDNDQSYGGENEVAPQNMGPRKPGYLATGPPLPPPPPPLSQNNGPAYFNKLNNNFQAAVVQEYYVPSDCLKGPAVGDYSQIPIQTSGAAYNNGPQAASPPNYVDKMAKYPSYSLTTLGEVTNVATGPQSLDSEDLDPSKLDLKIIHLPISIFKKLMGTEELKVDSY